MQWMQEQKLRLQILLQSLQAASPSRRHQNPRRLQMAPSYWRLDLYRLDLTPLSLSVSLSSLYVCVNFLNVKWLGFLGFWIIQGYGFLRLWGLRVFTLGSV